MDNIGRIYMFILAGVKGLSSLEDSKIFPHQYSSINIYEEGSCKNEVLMY